MLPALKPTQTVSGSDGQEVGEAGRSHPVAQIGGIPAFDEQDVDLLDEGNPALIVEARERGELEHSQGLPAQSEHGCPASSGDELPGLRGPVACPYDAVGMQSASQSPIGFPSSSSIAALMLGFLMPAEVRRNFNLSETPPKRGNHRSPPRPAGEGDEYGATSSAITSNQT